MRRIKCHSCVYYKKAGRDEEGVICTAAGTPTVKQLSTIKWCTSYRKVALIERIKRIFKKAG